MASFVNGGGSEKVTIDGQKVKSKKNLVSEDIITYKELSSPPLSRYSLYPFIFGEQIHALNKSGIYSWDGSAWTEISTAPISISTSRPVCTVYNSKLHIFGKTEHYVWDGNVWTKMSDRSARYYFPDFALVYNNKLYVLTPHDDTEVWDESTDTWSETSDIPRPPDTQNYCSLCVYRDCLYAIKYDEEVMCYILENNSWSPVRNLLPTDYSNYPECDVVVFNDKLHITITKDYSNGVLPYTLYTVYDGNDWKQEEITVFRPIHHSVITYKDSVHILMNSDDRDFDDCRSFKHIEFLVTRLKEVE